MVSELHSRSPISRLGRAVLRIYIASNSLVGMMTAALSRSWICPRECAVERRMATPRRPPSNHDGRTSHSRRTLTCFSAHCRVHRHEFWEQSSHAQHSPVGLPIVLDWTDGFDRAYRFDRAYGFDRANGIKPIRHRYHERSAGRHC